MDERLGLTKFKNNSSQNLA